MATSTLHDVFESDVNVQIGEGEDLEVIHGCAAAMAKASRPFDKMLHGGFSEGLTPAGTRMKTVVLLDDDPSSVKLVLRIVCSPVEHLAPVDSVEDVCGLAAVADKYECNVIVGNVVKRWTETWDTGSGEALYMQLCICASLNFSDDFRKHTATMARQDISIDLNDTQNPATKQLSLPSGLTDAINAQVRDAKAVVNRSLRSIVSSKPAELQQFGICISCKICKRAIGPMQDALDRALDLLYRTSIAHFFERTTSKITECSESIDNICPNLQEGIRLQWAKVVGDIERKAMAKAKGLCLECLKQSKDQNACVHDVIVIDD